MLYSIQNHIEVSKEINGNTCTIMHFPGNEKLILFLDGSS
jgi:hypothetical protein